jgi:hypothetical protein
VSLDAGQTYYEEEDLLSDDDGFEFVEDVEEDETSADDVPIFKQRATDKKR